MVERGSVRNLFDPNLVEFEAEMVAQWCKQSWVRLQLPFHRTYLPQRVSAQYLHQSTPAEVPVFQYPDISDPGDGL